MPSASLDCLGAFEDVAAVFSPGTQLVDNDRVLRHLLVDIDQVDLKIRTSSRSAFCLRAITVAQFEND